MDISPELSLAIPLYNEEGNVERVVGNLTAALDKEGVSYEIILVDNGSTDKTRILVDALCNGNPRLRPVHLDQNAGYGGGIQRGLAECAGRYIGYTAADDQVRAEDVVRIFTTLKQHDVDLCKARRVVRHDGLARKIVARVYALIFPLFFRVSSRDIHGWPRIFKREWLRRMALFSMDWFIDAEIMVKAEKLGLRVLEVPVVLHRRSWGRSKIRMSTILEFAVNLTRYRLGGRL
ncbi:MAG: glycosyltransferase family 2 protein [Acidobacteriota bacterium]